MMNGLLYLHLPEKFSLLVFKATGRAFTARKGVGAGSVLDSARSPPSRTYSPLPLVPYWVLTRCVFRRVLIITPEASAAVRSAAVTYKDLCVIFVNLMSDVVNCCRLVQSVSTLMCAVVPESKPEPL